MQVLGLDSLPGFLEVEETGDSFAANAMLKAVAASQRFRGLVLADDSGLEVDALGAEPGVRSARYAGATANQQENNLLLLENLSAVRGKLRSARFHCALAAAQAGHPLACFHGSVEGTIIRHPKGRHGFGYDPLFVPEGFCQTFAQLGPEIKNSLSHRARAIEAARPWILQRLTRSASRRVPARAVQ